MLNGSNWSVQGTFDAQGAFSEHMRVEHGGANVSMAHQLLDCPDVIPRPQQVGGEAMPKRVATRWLDDAGFTNGYLNRTLNRLLVDMMAYRPSGVMIGAKRGCGEYVLPAPLRRVCRIFKCQRIRQRYTRFSRFALLIKAKAQLGKVHPQWIQDRGRQYRNAILAALRVANDDLAPLQYKILDAKPKRLHQAQATAVEQIGDEPRRSVELSQHRAHFSNRQHNRQPFGAASSRHILQPGKIDFQYPLVE